MAAQSKVLTETAAQAVKRSVSSVVRVPDHAWPALFKVFSIRSLDGGEFLVRTGDSPEEMGVVVNGVLRTYYERADGSIYVRHFSAEGGVFGSFGSWLKKLPSSVAIDAIEATEIAVCCFSEFEALYAQAPYWQEYGRKLAEGLYLLKERREAQLLMLSAADRYRDFVGEFGSIQSRLMQRNIASYLGITPESLSRIRRAARDQGGC